MILVALLACRTTLVPDVRAGDDPTSAWASTLLSVVDDHGDVDYDLLREHREALDRYVRWLGRPQAVPSADKKALAFWLNAYNALVLYEVLETGTPASVRDVPGWGGPGSGFFVEHAFHVGPDVVSLWQIEHERIREASQDYRVHAAMSRATRSGPPLRATLYREPGLDAELDAQMRRWVADPARGVRIEGDEAVVSPIFDDYRRDFTLWTGDADLCTVLAGYADHPLQDELLDLATRGCPHRAFEDDPSLNRSNASLER